MDHKNEPALLSDFIDDQLPVIDDVLSKDRKPLHLRPLSAAQLIVEHCIVEIEGDDKDNYLDKPWFAALYHLTKDWYERRYADAMQYDIGGSILGVVLMYRMPFEVNIPRTFTEIAEVGKTAWVYFPNKVLEQESVLSWLIKGPNLEELPEKELSALRKEITTVATESRSIRLNLSTANLELEQQRMLSEGVQAHVETAVRHILSQADSRILNSFWEIHLAVEKALKLLILQHGEEPPRTHDLRQLCAIANQIELRIDIAPIEKLPPHEDVIKMRYGEGELKDVSEAISNYRYSLNIIRSLTESLKRRIRMNNARFLIKKLPFV